jgi:hypothetical protein
MINKLISEFMIKQCRDFFLPNPFFTVKGIPLSANMATRRLYPDDPYLYPRAFCLSRSPLYSNMGYIYLKKYNILDNMHAILFKKCPILDNMTSILLNIFDILDNMDFILRQKPSILDQKLSILEYIESILHQKPSILHRKLFTSGYMDFILSQRGSFLECAVFFQVVSRFLQREASHISIKILNPLKQRGQVKKNRIRELMKTPLGGENE